MREDRRSQLGATWRRGLRRISLALALGLLSGCTSAPQSLAAVVDPYARPGLLVALPDGRRLNLRCSGDGTPLVILESGFGGGAAAWFKVQAALARTTRVCAYDRAGYGFSDPGPTPRDAIAVARDLDHALQAARISGPFVVVGHSAGGFYSRVFAARRPQDVKGLVLLDPTVERLAPRPIGDGLDGIRRRVTRCLAIAETDPQPPTNSPEWAGCLPGRPNPQDLVVARRSASWIAQLSELDTLFGPTSEAVMRVRELLGGIPTYVITAKDTAGSTPALGFGDRTALEYLHLQIAAASRQGSQRTVLSSHMVMIDRPDVVVAAVGEMVAAVRTGREPEPLGPSESSQVAVDDILKGLLEPLTEPPSLNTAPPAPAERSGPPAEP